MFVGVVALRYQHHTCVVLITESFRVPRRPRWWGKGGTIRVNRSLKVYGILSNARSHAVLIKKLCKKLLVLRTIEFIKSARMSSVKIMVSSHLVESATTPTNIVRVL